jgi:arylsulfatase A-like enzyme
MNLYRGGNHLSPEATTLAERLRDEGFKTAAFLSAFTLRRDLGLDQGFEIYDAPELLATRPGDQAAAAAAAWLTGQAPEDRLFLWFHTYDAHGPWDQVETPEASADWARTTRTVERRMRDQQVIDGISDPDFYAQRYARSVEKTDAQVGIVLDALRTAGRLDQALIVLASDHGESFTERELWFAHGTSALDEQLHIPLIIQGPQRPEAGKISDRLTSLADVVPSVLAWLQLPEMHGIDGLSFADGSAGHSELLGESSHCKSHPALRCSPRGSMGKEFVLRTADETIQRRSVLTGARWRRYDRHEDPRETRSLSVPQSHPARRTLSDEARWRKTEPFASHIEPMDDDETAALRTLGYVD